jgi:DnaK suppressor protein
MANPTNDSNRGNSAPSDAGRPSTESQAIDPRWQRFYDRLVRHRDALIDAVRDLHEKAREVSPDPIHEGLAETATESYQRDQTLGLVSLDQEMLADVNLAISKIRDGRYGICELTGKPIPEERLEALPWARFTVEAQEAREMHGEAPKTAVGTSGQLGRSSLPVTGPATPNT